MKRHVISLSVLLILGSLRGWPQESMGEPTVTLGIEVIMRDKAVFYIPALGEMESEDLHRTQTPEGRTLICLNSLLKRVQKTKTA